MLVSSSEGNELLNCAGYFGKVIFQLRILCEYLGMELLLVCMGAHCSS